MPKPIKTKNAPSAALQVRYAKILADRNRLLKKDLAKTTSDEELVELRRQVQSLTDSHRAREDALCSTLGVQASGDVIPAIRSLQRSGGPIASAKRPMEEFAAVWLGEARDMLAKAMKELGITDSFTE